MRTHRFLYVFFVLALLTASAGAVILASPTKVAASSPNSVVDWSEIAIKTIVTNAKLPPSHAIIAMAYVHAAMYDAVVTIEGGYEPYALRHERSPGASIEAAVAAAAHDVLVKYFPTQQAGLDTDYATALAAVADGPAKTAGIEVGQAAAAALIELRKNDGYMADIGYQVPPFSPGVWQPLPGQTPLIPWLSKMDPFLLNSRDQFILDGPPSLTSGKYARDFNEVKEIGALNSTTRTEDQTITARVFTGHPIPQNLPNYLAIIQKQNLNAVDAAHFLALSYLTVADANIACYVEKYKYQFWRPQAAIRQADLDGNPATVADPNWLPLIGTPPFPEYVSGHGCFTSSTAEMMAAQLGTRNVQVTLRFTDPNTGAQYQRYYETVEDWEEAVINVRVWGGIHFRNSDEDGVKLGTAVARWTLKHSLLPVK